MTWRDTYFQAGQRDKVPVRFLDFDRSNPRFTPDKRPADDSESSIIEYLNRTADLGELIQSIASSGYVDIEPLIVMAQGEKLVVLEGNRRLAALKCLLDPSLALQAKITVPEIDDVRRETMLAVTAFKVEHPDDARNLIGFKHINGPQGWDAYAKALYAANWLDDEVAKGSAGLSLTDIAARMGDKHDTLYRIVSAVYVLQQAEELELFSVEDRSKKNFHFSHLYTALTYTEYREFLGLPRADRSANPVRNPIQTEFLPRLRELLLWLYGSRLERIEPAIRTQAPDLSHLKRVLGHPVARVLMMERGDLDEALQFTVEGSDRFIKALVDAQAALRAASTELSNASPDDEAVEISLDIRKRAVLIHNSLEAARLSADEEQ